ncbi:hypothetical protein NL676_017102 [Syzygium grande]|nr:hypothetical protein NL676_017102 [Syzygium grande]
MGRFSDLLFDRFELVIAGVEHEVIFFGSSNHFGWRTRAVVGSSPGGLKGCAFQGSILHVKWSLDVLKVLIISLGKLQVGFTFREGEKKKTRRGRGSKFSCFPFPFLLLRHQGRKEGGNRSAGERGDGDGDPWTLQQRPSSISAFRL